MMLNLWLGVAALSAFAILIVIYPLWKQQRQRIDQVVSSNPEQDNVVIFKDRLTELEAELASGSLSSEEFETLKLELEKNLLLDVEGSVKTLHSNPITHKQLALAALLGVAVVFASLGLYERLGSAPALEFALNAPAQGEAPPTIEEAIAQLQQQLTLQPENPEGWYLLASTLMGRGDYVGAVSAYRNTLNYLTAEDVQYSTVMGQLAQAMFFLEGSMSLAVREQVEATLTVEPFEISALGILGIDAFERKAFREAIGFWSKALINAEGDAARSLTNGVQRAREELIALGEDVSDLELPERAEILVRVSVSPELKASVSPDTAVFIVAQPVTGGMPLAGMRATIAELPLEVRLSDQNSMSPQAKLSDYEQVKVSARLSVSGNVAPQPGDSVVQMNNISTIGSAPLVMELTDIVK